MLGNNKQSQNRTILVVEDNDVDRKVIVSALEKRGYKTITANNGVEGLEKARENKPDLVLLDCEMPQMGGLEMCKQLREDENFDNIPVMFLTSVNTPQNIIDCFELDAENFLSKPIIPKILTSTIDSILKEISSS